MIRKTPLPFFLIFLLISASLFASEAVVTSEDQRKSQLELEWEPSEGAEKYEVEIKLDTDQFPTFQRIQKETKVIVNLKPGNYLFRIRSIHKTEGPGPWSEEMSLPVFPTTVVLLEPEDQSTLISNNEKKHTVIFKWQAAQNATNYFFRIWRETKQTPPMQKRTEKTEITMHLRPGFNYLWEVEPWGGNRIQYDTKIQTFSFRIIGEALEPPLASVDEIRKNNTISWNEVPKAQYFDLKLYRRDILGEEWKIFAGSKRVEGTEFKIEKELQAGEYKLEMVSRSPSYIDSEKTKIEFLVKPSARDIATIKR